ncbi:ninein homolog isoform X2 [Battus philenor]|uniref:ninein homolog isoform X2 n=1 Tax=Battus philenor TaxID=42288 RepID=UPI0035CF83EF
MQFCTMYKITYVSRKQKLEDRGVALVDSLFERRSGRVTFAQFRNGLLSVLGGGEAASMPATAVADAPAAPVAVAPAAPTAPSIAHSDDESSGREVAPKFVFGSKKYGRRSRPQQVSSESTPRPRVASDSRLDGERARQRMRCKRSASAVESREPADPAAFAELEHERRVDRDGALALCRSLRMNGIDSRRVDGVFDQVPADEITVGDFFDQLNVSLTTSIASTLDGATATAHDSLLGSEENKMEEALPSDAVVEAWERAGVQRPRRLLLELGFAAATVRPPDLERALDDELQALTAPHDRKDARHIIFWASLALLRLRLERSEQAASVAIAERDKLRLDLAEANRRARLLAQDVDENHARIEAELKASLRQVEVRHAEATRAAAAEVSGERERAAAERLRLEEEIARRVETEGRLRVEAGELRARLLDLESRALAAEDKAQQAERERARLAAEARAAEQCGLSVAEAECVAAARHEAVLEDLRRENKALRDRNDELCAELEAAPRTHSSWRDEAPLETSLPLYEPADTQRAVGIGTLRNVVARIRALSSSIDDNCATCSAVARIVSILNAEVMGVDASVQSEPCPYLDASKHAEAPDSTKQIDLDEKAQLMEVISGLESSLEQLRLEYDKCEEYWSRKLDEEREIFNEEQRAGDARLADLAAKIADYERQFARAPMPAIDECAALEHQVTALEDEFAAYRRDAEVQLRARSDDLARAKRRLDDLERRHAAHAQPASHPPFSCTWCAAGAGGGAALRARAARAERAAQRLAARLAAADLLVKDLYLENCRLAHRPRMP